CDFWFQLDHQWQRQCFYDPDGMFRYRRLQRSMADDQVRVGDITVLNWSTSPVGCDDRQPDPDAALGCGNDYVPGVLVGIRRAERQEQIQRACDRTQAYVHFLQTETGDLKPRGDLTWTANGIALAPYIREARRGVSLTTIRHQDVAKKFFPDAVRARTFGDSVGIGQYHYLDMHPNDAPGQVELGDGHDALPFTISLGALIPERTDGLILSSKSIGTTHITNAAYRMHPAEWAIGEAGGHLAAFALRANVNVRDVAAHHTYRLQHQLTQAGIPIVWLNDVSHDDPDFAAIQFLATVLLSQAPSTRGGQRSVDLAQPEANIPSVDLDRGFMDETCLGFGGDAIATPQLLATALTALICSHRDLAVPQDISISLQSWAKQNLLTPIQALDPHQPLTRHLLSQLFQILEPQTRARLAAALPEHQSALCRRDIARILSALVN
ncbi:MAG: FAD-dependent oxidoreductase, partial [Cyanobacteria bacterium P01_A01_bin.17]